MSAPSSATLSPGDSSSPRLSVVVPLYNCLALTQAMIASFRATVPPEISYEIILVDDGSTDGTRDWLFTLQAPFRVVLNERNLGYAGANNRGAAIATGQLLVLLNNDLVLTPGWLEPMLAALRRLGARAGVIGNIQRDASTRAVDHSGIFINLKAKPEHDHALPPRWWRWIRRTRNVAAVTGACALIERTLWRQLGGFDEGFSNGGEDVDLCFRAHAAGRVNAVALRSIVLHHVSSSPGRKLRDEQNSRRLATKWRNRLEALAWRRWCWNYLDREWTSPHAAVEYRSARGALFYSLRLRRTPPEIARDGMRAAMDREFARWGELLR
jgi:GT2 family glycosyltransferase